jgi:hypothetical protein
LNTVVFKSFTVIIFLVHSTIQVRVVTFGVIMYHLVEKWLILQQMLEIS